MRTRTRRPTPPGEILQREFLEPMELTQKQLAEHLKCDVKTINRLVKGHTSVSPAMAIMLGAAFETTPDFWLNLQRAVDLYEESLALEELPGPLRRAGAK